MIRHWSRAVLAAALACCVAVPSSARPSRPSVDADTTRQLTVAASALLDFRSQALVERRRQDRRPPTEVLGVKIAPDLAEDQQRAVRELANRNRAPVPGGPAYVAARTRLSAERAVRHGDRITLDVTEHTDLSYGDGRIEQSVRRRFEFVRKGEQLVLVGERVTDPGAHPVNDPDPDDQPSPPKPSPTSETPEPTPTPTTPSPSPSPTTPSPSPSTPSGTPSSPVSPSTPPTTLRPPVPIVPPITLTPPSF
ncbi:hypothetical protein [Actinomadura rupiterrae]|uniref:hypothetical protein n=1 Tax=Actinomadura rupiterrae TaxID=559627 RepID=UPI0020A3DA60|nr:hypothetical protein [Actinomadura rupiterrae]MCP2335448.1 hypothetical protein [Actinomadura rupiterrae]